MGASFLLSHHGPEEWDRTYAVGPFRLCARCIGTYPSLVFSLVAQFRHHAPWHTAFDVPAVLLLTLPALVDWSLGRLHSRQGTNVFRTLSGALLGMALGRSLYVHFEQPFPKVLLAQAALVTAVAAPVILLSLRRKRSR